VVHAEKVILEASKPMWNHTLKGSGLMKDRSVDCIGPLEEDAEGNKFICVSVDKFHDGWSYIVLYQTMR